MTAPFRFNSPRPLPAQSYLRECLDYAPDTGALAWRERPLAHFKSRACAAAFNARCARRPAFEAIRSGYKSLNLDRRRYSAHRLIWKWVTGDDPEIIDHINGDRTDNRWENLRSTSCGENQRNVSLYRNNKSGRVGVLFHKASGKWCAHIRVKRRNIHLGLHSSFEDACAARAAAEAEHGFHANHGRGR